MTTRHELMGDLLQQSGKNGLGIAVTVAAFIGGMSLQDWVLVATLVSVLIGGAHSAYKLARDIIRDRRARKLIKAELGE